MQSKPRIKRSNPREDIRVTFPDGVTMAGPVGTPVLEFINQAVRTRQIHLPAQSVAAIVDGKLRELAHPLTRDASITPITMVDIDGARIYRRSLILLLATTIDELWAGAKLRVNYAVSDGGFYCELVNRAPLSKAELNQLSLRMKQTVRQDDAITKRSVSISEARALFESRSDQDKVRLLQFRNRDNITLYSLHGRDDYYFGYLVPSTGYLKTFRLIHTGDAFILQYPHQTTPQSLGSLRLHEKLSTVFHQASVWLERLAIEDIGRLNLLVRADRIQEIILVAEALHEQLVASIATRIAQQHARGTRIVLIAGPSSSGKTTFSRRLAIQLLAQGLRPYTVEMDNYFVDRHLTPRDETGDFDFESLFALNLPLLNDHLLRMLQGERVQMPKFDFLHGKSTPGRYAQLHDKQIIILEGIHGLNPNLLPMIPPESLYRIYVSVLSQLNIDMHNRIPTTDVRLLRRIVRDTQQRGYSATDTLGRWQSVLRGEQRNIFPYQENADVMFNSALPYELAALRPLAEPLLLQVPANTHQHIEANRLLSFLRWVEPLHQKQTAMIPDTSLLREFIGQSILADYHPGEPESTIQLPDHED
jgi:uridine kinase